MTRACPASAIGGFARSASQSWQHRADADACACSCLGTGASADTVNAVMVAFPHSAPQRRLRHDIISRGRRGVPSHRSPAPFYLGHPLARGARLSLETLLGLCPRQDRDGARRTGLDCSCHERGVSQVRWREAAHRMRAPLSPPGVSQGGMRGVQECLNIRKTTTINRVSHIRCRSVARRARPVAQAGTARRRGEKCSRKS